MLKNKKYNDFEDLMVLNAKNYVKLYNININEQTYITINEIGLKPISNCSNDSGVNIYRKNNTIIYKHNYINDLSNDNSILKCSGSN